jgi:hypothetical protein
MYKLELNSELTLAAIIDSAKFCVSMRTLDVNSTFEVLSKNAPKGVDLDELKIKLADTMSKLSKISKTNDLDKILKFAKKLITTTESSIELSQKELRQLLLYIDIFTRTCCGQLEYVRLFTDYPYCEEIDYDKKLIGLHSIENPAVSYNVKLLNDVYNKLMWLIEDSEHSVYSYKPIPLTNVEEIKLWTLVESKFQNK